MPDQKPIEQPQCSHQKAEAGWAFPAGPLIPRPDASRPPLWPGLLQTNIQRLNAAVSVIDKTYRPVTKVTKAKVGLTGQLDQSFRNWWQRCYPAATTVTVDTPLSVLQHWLDSLRKDPTQQIVANDFERLITRELAPRIKNLYDKGRNNKRFAPLLFCSPYYPAVGSDLINQSIKVQDWESAYSPETRKHVCELLEEPAGEWNLLTLLFLKLLHIHLAWILPSKKVKEDRKNLYYRSVLQLLRQCALQVDEPNPHPLAETTAGLLQALSRVDLLLSGKDHPFHTDPLDPRHPDLPDSLHIDSCMSASACINEVRQILTWMEVKNPNSKGQWLALQSWVDEVALLAWEMASARTDPFSLGGLRIADANAFKGKQVFTRFREDWAAINRGIGAFLRNSTLATQVKSKVVKQIPEAFVNGADALNQMAHFVSLASELRSTYGWMETALAEHGLNTYQQFTTH